MVNPVTDIPKRSRLSQTWLWFLILMCLCFDLTAQVHHIDPIGGTNVSTCGTAASPCQSIQYAMEIVAGDGDTIYLFAGTYSLAAAVTIDSAVVEFPPNMGLHFIGDSTGSNAVIDGNGMRRGFHYDHSGNCPSSNGPHNAIADTRRFSFHNIVVQNCRFPGELCGSTTQSRGGGIHVLADPLDSLFVQITNCTFQTNLIHDSLGPNNHGRAAQGGAVYVHGRFGSTSTSAVHAELLVDSCKFTNNGAVQLPNGGWGGAIALTSLSESRITNSSFCSNYVFGINSDNGDLQHDRNAGGAILIYDQSNESPPIEYEIDHCTFINNSATIPSGSSFSFASGAGGVFMTRGDNLNATINAILQISNSDFYGNFNEVGTAHIGNNSGTLDTVSIGNNQLKESFDSYLGPDTSFCGNDSIILNAGLSLATYLWMDGSTDSILVVTAATPDTIWVEVDLFGCVFSDTIVITNESVSPILLGNDTALCRFDSLILDPDLTGVNVMWQDSSVAQTFQVDSAGTYWFMATYPNGCVVSDTIHLTDKPPVITGLGDDTTVCNNTSLVLDPGFTNVTYEWLDGSDSNALFVDSAGIYWFTAIDSLGCIFTDTQAVSMSVAAVNLGADTTYCLIEDQRYVLVPDAGVGSFLWNDGSQNADLAISGAGLYWVQFTNNIGCQAADSINVDIVDQPEVYFESIPSICEGEELTLHPFIKGDAELSWFNGATSDSVTVNQSGTYSLTATNDCATATAEITVSMNACGCNIFIPNILTPNQDGFNDDFHPEITCKTSSYELVIYNRWGSSVFHSTQLEMAWDGFVNGELMSEGTYYYVIHYLEVGTEDDKRMTGSFSLIY